MIIGLIKVVAYFFKVRAYVENLLDVLDNISIMHCSV